LTVRTPVTEHKLDQDGSGQPEQHTHNAYDQPARASQDCPQWKANSPEQVRMAL